VNRDAAGDALSPAELRLLHHLQVLRADPPEPTAELSAAVVGGVRWQREVRPYLVATGGLAAGVAAAAGVVLGAGAPR
jgi:hypothetical protein